MPITPEVKVSAYSAGLACFAILSATGCNEVTHPSGLPIAEALRLARGSSEATVYTCIKGVISLADIQTGNFVVEDSSGGVRIALGQQQTPQLGDAVEVAGFLQTTDDVGVMLEPTVRIVGKSRRPQPILIGIENLTGYPNRTVTVRGTVESVQVEATGLRSVRLRAGSLHADTSLSLDSGDTGQLVDAVLEVTGVLARTAASNRDPMIWSRDVDDVKVVQPAPPRNSIPNIRIEQLRKIRGAAIPSHRLRVQGSLTTSASESFLIQDETGNLRVRFNKDEGAPSSRQADIVGFLNFEEGQPWLVGAEPTFQARAGLKVLHTAREVHQLSYRAAAFRPPVKIRAVVTYNHARILFVQDDTDGVYVFSKLHQAELNTGDLVEIDGESEPGEFAPGIGNPKIRVVGRAALPEPTPDTEAAFTGRQDCRWVQFDGVVQRVTQTSRDTLLSVVWGTHFYKAHIPVPAASLEGLVDREVTLRGVVGALFNDRRQFLGVQVFVPAAGFVTLKDTGTHNPRAVHRTIKSLLQFSPSEPGSHRESVEGTVTLSNPEGPTWIRDNTGGLLILSHSAIALQLGDVVDVLGYPQAESFGPAMRDAQITKVRSGKIPEPIRISVDEAMRGSFESQLVEVAGVVISSSVQGADPLITIRANPYLFAARLASSSKSERLAAVSPGARVVVRGIISAIVDRRKDTIVPRGFQISLRSSNDLIVTRSAPWLTTARLGLILAASLLLVFGSVCWIMLLRRSVGRQTQSLLNKTLQLETALDRARAAEAIDTDRKAILELVAKDEPLEKIMRAIREASAKHLEIANSHVDSFPEALHAPILEPWTSIASLAVERRGFVDQLSYRAQHDNLTGLVNRASLFERLEMELIKTSQEGHGLSVIYLDLDGFKKTNDRYGHDAGDAVLREVSLRLKGSIRRSDVAARMGDDEFVVLLPGVDNRVEALQLCRLIMDALRVPVQFGPVELETGASLGIAVYPEDGTQAEVLLKSADEEMYRRKGRRKAQEVDLEICA